MSAFAASERNDQVLVIYLGVDVGDRSFAILELSEYFAILFVPRVEFSFPIFGPGLIYPQIELFDKHFGNSRRIPPLRLQPRRLGTLQSPIISDGVAARTGKKHSYALIGFKMALMGT